MAHEHASLFVGRWQPFHEGHRALIETVLKKGKPVVVAIRDTEISVKNPYTVGERWGMIQTSLHEYGNLVKIITVPDIDEICYGRDVGYGIRKIELGSELESVSGTRKRRENPPMHPIVWLTGQTGAGKTTIANLLRDKLSAVVLDGDEMRESISLGATFSRDDRTAHNLRIARLAAVLARQQLVIVAVIAPFASVRAEIDALIQPLWVHVHKRGLPTDSEHPYEIPQDPSLSVNSDTHSPEENAALIASFLQKEPRIGL